MLNRLPTHLPSVPLMLEDLGQPSPRAIGRALGVHTRTVQRWIDADKMPRPAALSLFWVTRWGQSIVDAEAVNTARLYAGLARSYERELQQAHNRLANVLRIADFGSANEPVTTVTLGVQVR